MNNTKLICRFLSQSRNLNNHGTLTRKVCSINNARNMSASVSISQMLKDKETFQDVLPDIIESVTKSNKFNHASEVKDWVKQVLEYNLKGGKKARGLITVFAYEMMENPQYVREESLRLARTLGWCAEMLQAYLVVVDDIMDGSSTRRGMPCWYLMPNVGLGAINDSILIHCSIFETLKTYFGNTPQYTSLVELFNETLFLTSIGQHLDFSMAHRNKNDYSLFTIDRYNAIIRYKTAYYTFKLPVVAGMLQAKGADKVDQRQVEDICLELGRLFQIQDDFIDCFGDESVTGKAGTDIQEGKCSWLAVNALQRCSDAQHKIFVDNYGSKDIERVDRIKRLYEELQLPRLYAEQEQVIFDSIVQTSNALQSKSATGLFLKLLDMVYKRKQ